MNQCHANQILDHSAVSREQTQSEESDQALPVQHRLFQRRPMFRDGRRGWRPTPAAQKEKSRTWSHSTDAGVWLKNVLFQQSGKREARKLKRRKQEEL